MAKFKSLIFAEIRGSINGVVFSRNRFAAYTRNRTAPVQPRTSLVLARRQILTNLARRWRTLDQTQRDAWTAFAKNIQRSNSLGDLITLTGLQAYVGYNSTRNLFGLPTTDNPPGQFQAPPALTSMNIAIDTSSQIFDISFTPTPYQGGLVVRATPPMSAGRLFVAPGDYRIVRTVNGPNVTSPIDLWAFYVQKFGVPPIGTRVAVKLSPVMWGVAPEEQGGFMLPGLTAAIIVTS